jgi:hypothetical protein
MKTEEKPAAEFPLAGGASWRAALRPTRLRSEAGATPAVVMGNRAFLRAWAARRGARIAPAAGRLASEIREAGAP